MVVWQGITSGGTAVPIQVTEAGEVVAATNTPVPGPEGPPGPDGPPGADGKDGKDGAPGRDGDQWVEVNSRLIMPTKNVGISVLLDADIGGSITSKNVVASETLSCTRANAPDQVRFGYNTNDYLYVSNTNSAGGFVFKNSVSAEGNPWDGGETLMQLDGAGNCTIKGSFNPATIRLRLSDTPEAPLVDVANALVALQLEVTTLHSELKTLKAASAE